MARVVLRCGFYDGPRTWFHPDGDVGDQVRAGQYPVLGTGAGRWSFVPVEDAVAAVESDVSGALNICDDAPVPIAQWLPAFAGYVDGPPLPHVAAGPGTDPDGRFYAEQLRGADSSRARAELGFAPRLLPWR